MPERARRILDDSGLPLSPQELLDALWLATRLPAPGEEPADPEPRPEDGAVPPQADDAGRTDGYPGPAPVLPSRAPGR
ncbi:hypothetical protein C3486_29450, partial [Streptomyces sp. Ru73]